MEKEIIEVKHIEEGKKKLQESKIEVPSYEPFLQGRWRAVSKEKNLKLDAEQLQILNFLKEYIPTLTDVTTQRALYYTLRGSHPEWKYHKNLLGSGEFYLALTGWFMEKLQIIADCTMQSFGVWAAPKGYIAGDGNIYTERRGNVPLKAQPTLAFDLCDAEVETEARKVLHFEKDAGFSSIIAGDMPKYIEAMFSTAQGQLVEAANKFLADREKEGKKIYCVHDGDAYGIQMQLLYGLASKHNCYMPTEFYAQKVESLGFFPRIAKALGLPSEETTENEEKIFHNLNEMNKVKGNFTEDIRILEKEKQKWEFQALNAIHEKAPQIYIIEGLKQFGDEIKYAPPESQIKIDIVSSINERTETSIRVGINSSVNKLLEEKRNLVIQEVKDKIVDDIESYRKDINDICGQARKTDYREAIKLELVKNPSLYYQDALRRVTSDILDNKFEVEVDAEVSINIKSIKVNKKIILNGPQLPDHILTKEDICDSIEKEVMSNKKERTQIVTKIRDAFEKCFGKPDLGW